MAQNITLHENNASLTSVFNAITQQTGYHFFYANGIIKKNTKVTVNVTNASLRQVLDICFAQLPVTYTIVDKTIVIKEDIGTKQYSLKSDSLFAKQYIYKGSIQDANGTYLAAASITDKFTGKTVVSKEDGSFILITNSDKALLLVNYVNKEITEFYTVANSKKITIVLKDNDKVLEDVIVVAYQNKQARELKYATSTIDTKNIKDNPLNSLAQVLQGKLAGVQITLSEGAPGAEATINLRGRNSITGDGSPLYIVDGVPLENAINYLNPQDIASIYVLKDAASISIYGSRGANGIVYITTKAGKNTDGKAIVSYNSYVGVQKLAKKLDVLSPDDFVLYQWERAKWRGDTTVIARYTGNMNNFDTIENYYKNVAEADWQANAMGKNAFLQYHNINISGGNTSTTYNLSLTYNTQDGIVINSDFNRKSLNFKFDHVINNHLKTGFTFRYIHQGINGAGTSDVGSASFNRLRQFIRYRPLLLPNQDIYSYDENLDISNAANGLNIINPFLLSNAEVRKRNTTIVDMNAYAQYQFSKYLSFRTTVGYNTNNADNKSFDDTITIAARLYQKQPIVGLTKVHRSFFINSNVLTYANAALFKSKYSFSFVIGQEIQQSRVASLSQEIRYFPVGITAEKAFNNLQLASVSSAANVQPNPVSLEMSTSLASFFSAIDIDFNKKYFAKFTTRVDGSSIFSNSNQWGYFPSGSFIWRIDKEKFFKPQPYLSQLKLRLAYGTSGNNRIDPFLYKTTYMSPSNGGYGLNNALAGIYMPFNLGNEHLKWEKIISKSIGVDAELFYRRLNVSIDVYANKSVDLLLNNAIPSSSGYATQFQNIGATANKGIELQLSALLINKANFSWNASFNISFNKNTITSLGNNQQILRNSGWFSSINFPADYVLRVGQSTGLMYGFENDGFFTLADFNTKPFTNTSNPQFNTEYVVKSNIPNHSRISSDVIQPGSPKFKDINGDGIIDPDNDRVIIGNAQPKFFGGLNQSFTYKNFDFSIAVNFLYGNKIYNANKLEFSNAVGNDINLLRIMASRWKMIDASGNASQIVLGNTVVGFDANTLAAINNGAKIWFPSTSITGLYSQKFAIEDGSFVRVNNITLGYNLPKKYSNKLKISQLRLYATANIVFLISSYTGYDPDVNTRRNDVTTMGVDYSAYPKARTFMLGFNVIF